MSDITKVLALEVSKKTGNSPTVSEVEYTVPDGKTVGLQTFFAGHESSNQEARIELVWRDGATDTPIAIMYGPTTHVDVGEDFVGDGSKKLVIRAVNGDASPLHMFGRWRGRERGS